MSRYTPTSEDQRAAKAARAANIASTRPTTRPGSETTDLKIGDPVRVRRQDGRSGTWSRYAGREGWVASLNRQEFPSGTTYVEIGVAWHHGKAASSNTWFRADELVKL